MATYSIKDLESLSGIKAHTIRIWEQRYTLLEPERTSTNIRTYDEEQLKKLLNISLLVNNGVKISKIGQMTDEEIRLALLEYLETDFVKSNETDLRAESKINSLVVAMIDLDEAVFDKVFASSVLKRGFKETVTHVIYPFLHKVGILWGINDVNPAQEHFITNLIRQKIVVAIDSLMSSYNSDKKFMLYLPENELHEIGLLMAHYLIKYNKHQVYYLGQNVPKADVAAVYEQVNPNYVLSFLTTPKPASEYQEYINYMAGCCKNATLLLAGTKTNFESIDFPKNVVWLESMDHLNDFL